ncbi:MAG: DUF1349 domain-containing protein [Anaerolineaceae bacterium]|nr:DUF1349 domain-containing protein [Anaerolineaceae bacterium]
MNEQLFLNECFNNPALDERLEWFCEPINWESSNGKLILNTDAKTDFWARTHYGFINDNGHCLWLPIKDNFVLSTKVSFSPKNQYDQSGLIIRISPDCWLKTSVEYEPDEPNRLGVVVTNNGFSDWSTQDVSDEMTTVELRITRDGQDYTVEFRNENNSHWSQLRVAHLHDPAQNVNAGLYACSPIEAGYTAIFENLKITRTVA